jgi:hypothetical protein
MLRLAKPPGLLPVLALTSGGDGTTSSTRLYGYLRLAQQVPLHVSSGWCAAMNAYAEAHGYELVNVFVDGDGGTSNGFDALTETLRATGDRDVIVPDLEQLHPHPGLRDMRLNRLLEGLEAYLHFCDS